MLPAFLRRSPSRRVVVAGIAVLMALSAGVSWRLFHGTDIDLGIALTGTTRRPLTVVNGKVTQMPSGDYLAANTLVDTTGCSSTNVIAWNGSQFACAAAGGGGGGITNGAGNNVIMKSNGTNAIASGLSDDGTTITSAENVAFGSSSPGTPMWLNKSAATTTTQFYIQETDTNHTGNTGVNNEAINLVLDQRATFNTTADAVSASANALTILLSSTRVAGAKPLINDGLIIAVSGGDSNRAIHTTTGGGIVAFDDGGTVGPWTVTGAFTTGSGVTSIAGTAGSALSFSGTGGNITTASGTVTAASVHSVGILKADSEVRLDPGASGTQGYAYMLDATSGSNIHNLNVSSAGAGGKIIFQGNNVGTNSGTGGIEVWAGANGGASVFAIKGNGHTSASGTAITTGDLSSCGTTPAIATGSTDLAGTITEGTTSTGCTLTFKATYTNSPFCVCSGELTGSTAGVLIGCHATATTLVIENASASGNLITYHCTGRSGST